MVDNADLKSVGGNTVPVQVRLPALIKDCFYLAVFFFFLYWFAEYNYNIGKPIKEELQMYKNIDKKVQLKLKDQVECREGQVVSKTLVQNDTVSMTLFSFDKGEEISTHAAAGDAMVTVLEGTGRFTVGGDVFTLHEGDTLIMPKDIPHSVFGEEKFKMQLIVSY